MSAVKQLYLDPRLAQLDRPAVIAEIGSLDVDGSFRSLFESSDVEYVAAALAAGAGVEPQDHLPFDDGSVDVVLTGHMSDRTEFSWESFKEMTRVLSADGVLVINVRTDGPILCEHTDRYRFDADGFTALAQSAGVELVDCFHDTRGDSVDLVGVFRHHGNGHTRDDGRRLHDPEFRLAPPPERYQSVGPLDSRATFETAPLPGCEAAFWEIRSLRNSAWTGHTPFMFVAFDLARPRRYVELGCHHGASLFAACQARTRLRLDTECVAIDTWRGDEQTGWYGEEVLEQLREALVNEGYDFALLERSLFDDAAPKFDDESIDLLHIDGLHTYEAVRHDFETWFPKVTPGGLVMLHDIRGHQRDFGVWRLWQELDLEYETFAFDHCHGLGLLVKPGPLTPLTSWLRGLADSAVLSKHMQLLFETLGERSSSHAALADVRAQTDGLRERVPTLEADVETERTLRSATEAELAIERSVRSAAEAEVETERERHGRTLAERALAIDDCVTYRTHLSAATEELSATREALLCVKHEQQVLEGSRMIRLVRRYWRLRDQLRRPFQLLKRG